MADEQTAETTETPEATEGAQPPQERQPDADKAQTAEKATPPADAAEKPTEAKPEPAGPWYGEVDDDLKKIAERLASPADALRSIADFRKRESQVRVPGKDATDEDWAKYHKAIGVPDKPDGYEFPALTDEEMTEEVKESRAKWAETFHGLGVSKDQAKALIEAYAAEQAAQMQAQVEEDRRYAEESEAQLKREWPGKQFDTNKEFYNRGVILVANRAGVDVEQLRHLETKDGRFVMDHPDMIRMFAVIGREAQEGTLGGAVSEDARNTLQEQIDAMQQKIDDARGRGDMRRANELYQQQQQLYGRLSGAGPIVGSKGRAA